MRYGDNDIGVAMQTRCVHCLAEQYALNVIDVSYGEAGCAWCGAQSRLMTHEEYLQALTEAKEARSLREAADRRTANRKPPRRSPGE
jgi:hypothetical protein